ncbi:hypothetical protein CHISP_0927 [Chitinispirillum alkaliphilum]|nr:hypothetical protein CHISP_0927 [Chitinispirillum alkaliphilum]
MKKGLFFGIVFLGFISVGWFSITGAIRNVGDYPQPGGYDTSCQNKMTSKKFEDCHQPGSYDTSDQKKLETEEFWEIFRKMLDPDQPDSLCNRLLYRSNGIAGIARCLALHFPPSLVKTAIGVSPFIGGPHKADSCDWSNTRSFGYYNPEFVRRATELLIPERESLLSKILEPYYVRRLRHPARLLYIAHRVLTQNPELSETLVSIYNRDRNSDEGMCSGSTREIMFILSLKDETSLVENYLTNNNKVFNQQVVLFWLRRMIDGSINQFHDGLVKMISVFDPKFYNMWIGTPEFFTRCFIEDPFVTADYDSWYIVAQEKLQRNRKLMQQFASQWQIFCDTAAVTGRQVRLFRSNDVSSPPPSDHIIYRHITGIGECAGDTTDINFGWESISINRESISVAYYFNGFSGLDLERGMTVGQVENLLGTPARKNAHFMTYLSSSASDELHGDFFTDKSELFILFFVDGSLEVVKEIWIGSC